MNIRPRIPLVPASLFGIVLGVVGLGNAWRVAHRVWGLSAEVGEALEWIGSAVWLVLVLLYMAKWLFERTRAIEELKHPVQCCFVGLAGVTTMLVAGAIAPYSHAAASVLFALGAIYTIAFAVWRTGGLWQGGRDVAQTTAVLYLPAVAGSFLTAIVVSALGRPDWGQLAFGAGVFSWLALESVLVHRLFVAESLPVPMRPTLGIQLAPPAVGAIAYLSITSGMPDLFAHVLIGYALLQALVLLRLMPWIGKQPFAASYWAFSFGVTAIAIAPLRMIERGDIGPVATLAPWLFLFANVVIAVLSIGTLYLLIMGRLLPPVAAPVVPVVAVEQGAR
ncbi:dicarboxylate transporter/tellurite-resistance protein TehA [Rhodanobacter sp. L36]|uniref:dicarboxylate transporter/tellurite-resistance protein TehA n=1 Tax=Rhodanobacter sp. L36 TaxID=1747221 RepID=UPI00131D7802|nr:dicarboxylate transporter/tellurite-resistance protein TehA [Rhodanobacter sp. L36]